MRTAEHEVDEAMSAPGLLHRRQRQALPEHRHVNPSREVQDAQRRAHQCHPLLDNEDRCCCSHNTSRIPSSQGHDQMQAAGTRVQCTVVTRCVIDAAAQVALLEHPQRTIDIVGHC